MDKPIRILVIDPNPTIHEDFHKIVENSSSIQIDSAHNAEQALQCVQQAISGHTVVFFDLYANDLALIQRMWEIDPNLQVVLSIAYSAYTEKDITEKLQHPEQVIILNKPFDVSEIRQLVNYFSKKQAQDIFIQNKIIALEEKIQYQLTHDQVTGLSNRFVLTSFISQAISQAEQHRAQVGVVLLSIDYLQEMHSVFGDVVIDNLFKQLTEKLKKMTSTSDHLIQLSQEKFVIVLTDSVNEKNIIEKIDRYLAEFSTPFEVDNHIIQVSAHSGASLYPENGKEADTLLKNAEAALQCSKAIGKKDVQLFNSHEHAVILQQAEIILAFPHALKKNQFILHYQPLVKADSSQILGVEVLLRWQHPEWGLLYPPAFIALAEETGWISAIGEWVLKTACAKIKKWQQTNCPTLIAEVNVSSLQLCQPNFEWLVQSTLKKTELEPQYLELEIIASPLLMENPDILQKMYRLKELGIRFSLNNFGVGYANLDCLQFFPFDKVKIDRSFIKEIKPNTTENKVIEAIIYFAKKMGTTVVASGVETAEQVAFLFDHHGREMQGFYFSPPVNEEAFAILLEKQKLIVKEEG